MVNSSALCKDQLQLLTSENLGIPVAKLDQSLHFQFLHNPFDGS